MRDFVDVKTQVEMEKVLKDGNIPICRGSGYFYVTQEMTAYGNTTVRAYGNTTVRAYDNTTVRAYDNTTVRAYDNTTVRAYDNTTVEAYDNTTVEAYDNTTVEAYDNTTVEAYGNTTVEAYDNTTVRAYGNTTVRAYRSSAVTAGKYVAVHKMPNHTPEIRGGVIINVPELNTIETWADYYGLDVDDDGMITVFKCVHGKNGTSDNGGIYKVGAFTKCDDWRLNKECGGGLHFCARPLQTRAYSAGDQFLACKVDMRDAQVISADKIKAPLCFVEREVTIDGDPVS